MSDLRLEIFRRILEPLPREPLVDLGAGHCKFSRIAHEMGFLVTSVDARRERVPDDIEWPFIQRDVRDFRLARFRIVCCLGFLYHLHLSDQLRLMNECQQWVPIVIVDTHTAGRIDERIGMYEGLWFEEVEAPTAAFGNRRSFWHTEESLIRMFRDYGYTPKKIEPEHAPGRAFWRLTA